ncbi:MAG TPA: MarR family transcriptional regulator [Vicinamibacteria bacterium]|nr:MarR family transcriptional regulator [Vicinamibacteria bacterium]
MTLRLVPPIHRATHRIGLYLADLREHGLSQGEAHILAHLATSGAATVGELHAGLAHKRSTLTSILDRLAARALVTREVGAEDRRTFVVDLTARGRRVAAEVHRHLAALEAAVEDRVSKDELRGFLKVLAAVEELALPRRGSVRPLRSRRSRS